MLCCDQAILEGIIPDRGVSDVAWIGYHDRDAEAGCTDHRHQGIGGNIQATTFIWMDGTPSDYENWASGEPNDWQNGQAQCDGTGNEDCTEAWRGGTNWNDANCGGAKPYVCKICGEPCSPTDFRIYGLDNQLVRSAAAAEDECLRKGGHLASAHSQEDSDAIKAAISATSASTAHSSKERRRPLFCQPFSAITEPAPGILVPLSGILASRRRKQRKNGEKTSKNGRDMV